LPDQNRKRSPTARESATRIGNYVSNIFTELQVADRAQAMIWAAKHRSVWIRTHVGWERWEPGAARR
jgi:hypothetical protein